MGGSTSQMRSPVAERLHNSLDMSNSTTTFEKMCEDLMRRMSDSGERYQIREEILNSKSDEKSFARIFPFTSVYKMIRTSAETEKSEEKSNLFREKGNNSFAQNKYHEAILCYTQAIALAPFESQCLPLAYANRSAVLFAQCNMGGCLEDIRRALTWKYPAHLQYKVYMRKGQCYNILQYDLDKANRNFAKAEELISKSESLTDVQKQELKTKISNYKKTMPAPPPVALCSTCHGSTPPAISFYKNAELPSASSCVALTYNPSRGRHLVATRNIQPGLYNY
jgi:tetratricopeptide (TPR) repeat protein